jgi:hypothetical protein
MIGWFMNNELERMWQDVPGRSVKNFQVNWCSCLKSNWAPPEFDFGACVVVWVDTNISEEPAESIFRTRLKTETTGSSKMWVPINYITLRHIPENCNPKLE